MDRFPIASLIVAILIAACGEAVAQSASPAPPPGQEGQTQWPPVNGNSPVAIAPRDAFRSGGPQQPPGVSDECVSGYAQLRQDAQGKADLIKEARERHAPPLEACQLIGDYRLAEEKIIQYVEISSLTCGALAQVADRLRAQRRETQAMPTRVCAITQQSQKRPVRGPTGDFYPVRLLDMPEGRLTRAPSGLRGNVLDTLPK